MASQKQNFSRSNVNEETLQISAPERSSFDLSHSTKLTLPLGRFFPVNIEYLMPDDMLRGSLSPNLQLEKVVTPELGRLRIDTHTFAVNARRINKDWRQFVESARDFDHLGSKPFFDWNVLFGTLFGYFMTKLVSGYAPTVSLDTIAKTAPWYVDDATTPTTASMAAGAILHNYFISCRNAVAKSSTAGDYGYLADFFQIEKARVSTTYGSLFDGSIEFPADFTGDGSILAEVIEFVMKPYFGVGSIMDMIGYPIYRQYSKAFTVLDDLAKKNTAGYWAGVYGTVPATKNLKIGQIFLLDGFSGGSHSTFPTFTFDSSFHVDEMPFRAFYAAWYDYLRNWHVEKRANILDPDLFGSMSYLKSLNSTFDWTKFADVMQLLLVKYRMFARDGLTTVQEDDKYRHVYVPIPYSSSTDLEGYDIPDAHGNSDYAAVDNVINVLIQQMQTYFPGDVSVSFPGSSIVSPDIFRADLQVMKRTSMLYKYLARDFYSPDTYAGHVRARYSIVPDDINFLSSEYLGGDEKMVDGEQLKANVTTDDTPAGTRTFSGGGSLSDSFTYRASDFCYLVSFVSLVPLLSYDASNMHMCELTPFDLPDPEFAEDTRVAVTSGDMVRGLSRDALLGFVPRYYAYRQRLDELHGDYLTDKRSWDWTRDWYQLAVADDLSAQDFSLSPYALRVHLPVDAFLALREWDNIAYGKCDCQMIIDRPLPAAVEFI